MKLRMTNLVGKSCVLIMSLSASGCTSAEIKGLFLDQITEFATAITSATITAWIQSLIGSDLV